MKKDKKNNLIRILARISGVVASVVAIYFIVFKGMAPENQGNDQIITINIMMTFLIFGFIIGWWREKEGGIILTFGSAITYMYFYYLPVDEFPAFWFYSFIFAIPGLLFLYLTFSNSTQD